MNLSSLGYPPSLDHFRTSANLDGFEVGRVIIEHKERYVVKTESGEFDAEITGNMRYTAQSREDFPAVGDWVALMVFDQNLAIIQSVFPRSSVIRRQAVGHSVEAQIIATNIDYAFLVQAADRDFNINRLERYLTICHASDVSPVIVLTKTDLISPAEVVTLTDSIRARIHDVPVLAISNETGNGYEAIREIIEPGKTYCMLGSSGVGKSTLLNNLSGKSLMRTDAISDNTHKGRHVTTHRELIVLEGGGILIDNPGMREVGIADTSGGLDHTFDSITRLATDCRFPDCKHISEVGCAVLAAVEKGDIDRASYDNYLKMMREQAFYETSVEEKHRKDRIFGKMIKKYNDENR